MATHYSNSGSLAVVRNGGQLAILSTNELGEDLLEIIAFAKLVGDPPTGHPGWQGMLELEEALKAVREERPVSDIQDKFDMLKNLNG